MLLRKIYKCLLLTVALQKTQGSALVRFQDVGAGWGRRFAFFFPPCKLLAQLWLRRGAGSLPYRLQSVW